MLSAKFGKLFTEIVIRHLMTSLRREEAEILKMHRLEYLYAVFVPKRGRPCRLKWYIFSSNESNIAIGIE